MFRPKHGNFPENFSETTRNFVTQSSLPDLRSARVLKFIFKRSFTLSNTPKLLKSAKLQKLIDFAGKSLLEKNSMPERNSLLGIH